MSGVLLYARLILNLKHHFLMDQKCVGPTVVFDCVGNYSRVSNQGVDLLAD